jgi:predicted phage terminase large subunit-like protein
LDYKNVEHKYHGPVMNILQSFPAPSGREEMEEHDKWDPNQGKWEYTPLTRMNDIPGGRRRLILDPRSHLKTTINVQGHTIQWILNHPNIAILVTQSNIDKSVAVVGEIKKHFTHNPVFRQLFPEHCPQRAIGDWGTKAEFTTEARKREITRRESTVHAASIDKGLAGYHFDVMKFSDIVEPANTKTKTMIRQVIAGFYMMENLLVSPEYWIDVEGTRYTHSDLYGKLIEQWEKERLEEKEHEYEIHVRSGWQKVWAREAVEKKEVPIFTPDKLDLPNYLDEDNHEVPIWPVDNEGVVRFTYDKYVKMRDKDPYIFSCSRGDQKILMSDWTERPIKDVVPGDSIMGMRDGKLIPARVLTQQENPPAQLYKIQLASGRETYQTLDHRWWNQKKQQCVDPYYTVQAGDSLWSAYTPAEEFTSAEQQTAAAWLGGFFDGEGTVYKHYTLAMYQAKSQVEIVAKLRTSLELCGFTWSEHLDKRRDVIQFHLKGGRSELIRFVQQTGSVKGQEYIRALSAAQPQVCEANAEHKIVSMRPDTVESTYWLATETENYIVSGFVSRNCQQMNNPIGGVGGLEIFPISDARPRFITPENFRKVRIVGTEVVVDTAETTAEGSDFTAITAGSWDAYGRLYVRQIMHGKWTPDEICKNIVAAGQFYRAGEIKIEETSFVRGLMPTLQRYMQLTNNYLPVTLIKRDNQTAKTERIQYTLQPWYKEGLIVFLTNISPAARVAMMKELKEFPLGDHDDILDTLADFFQTKTWFGRHVPRGHAEKVIDRSMQDFLGITDPFAPDAGLIPMPGSLPKEMIDTRTGM